MQKDHKEDKDAATCTWTDCTKKVLMGHHYCDLHAYKLEDLKHDIIY